MQDTATGVNWLKTTKDLPTYFLFVCFATSCEPEIIFKNLNKQIKIILQLFSWSFAHSLVSDMNPPQFSHNLNPLNWIKETSPSSLVIL